MKKLKEIFSDGDLVLCQGAGSITHLPQSLMSWLEKEQPNGFLEELSPLLQIQVEEALIK